MSQKNKIIIGIIGVLLIFALLIILFYSGNDNDNNTDNEKSNNNGYENNDDSENNDSNNIPEELVTDSVFLQDINRYGIINNSLVKYYSYIIGANYSGLINLLDLDYRYSNNIDMSNIDDKIVTYNKIYTYEAVEVYYRDVNEGHMVYYVKGNLVEDILDGNIKESDIIEVYNIVYFDEINYTFSVEPISKVVYERNQDLSVTNLYAPLYIEDNGNNKYSNVNYSLKEIANIYFYDFRKRLQLGTASSIYTDTTGNYTFKIGSTIETYNVNKDTNIIILTDSEGFEYNFDIKHVLNYDLKITNAD